MADAARRVVRSSARAPIGESHGGIWDVRGDRCFAPPGYGRESTAMCGRRNQGDDYGTKSHRTAGASRPDQIRAEEPKDVPDRNRDSASGGVRGTADRLAALAHPHFFNERQNMLYRALKLLRGFHQLTQTELARRFDISNSYLSEIESGTKKPGIELLEKYAEVFKMPVSSILLFAERLESDTRPSEKIRVAAADKILRMLEWVSDRDVVTSGQ